MSALKVSLVYRKVSARAAIFQLLVTLVCYVSLLWSAVALADQIWLCLPLMAACGLAAVRLYMLQHDCMHRCFIRPRWLNDTIGILLSPFTLTPFYMGRYNHNQHHSHVGDLDRRDTFEINVMTVQEFRDASPRQRVLYRLYRSPLTLLVVGPFLVYGIVHRFPKNTIKAGLLWDVFLHNLLVVGYLTVVYLVFGGQGLAVLFGAIYCGVSMGAFIPYVEHNFETIHWGRRPELDPQTAALRASAVLDFGNVFHWVTANIGFHDLHHLNPNIPSYNLKRAYAALERDGLLQSHKITFRQGLGCLKWKLWDEEQQKMVGFAAL
ncbi:fatty acid desaturase [Cognatishimia sp. WU-CL00825]|uniref:fatty acid desaturase n=1 Tax=Cognatishimia sp. WU-CL00825 TaxID=3127658 RepID=UPI003102D2D5